jgi:fucose permease
MTRGSKTVHATLYAAFALAGIATTMLGPLMPALQAQWNIADSRAGLLFTAQFLASVCSAAMVGVLARRFGYGQLIRFGLLLLAAGVAACAVCRWPLALPCVAIYGCGLGLIIPAGNLGIAALHPGAETRPVMALNLCWCVGAVAAPILIASLAATFLWLQALLAAVLAVCSGADPWPAKPASNKLSAQREASPHLLTALLLFLYVGVESSIGGWVALLTFRSPGAQSLWAILPSAFWAGMLIGRMVTPSLLDIVRPRVIIVAGLLLAFAAAAYLIGGGSHGSVAAGALSGFGLAPVFPLVVAQYAEAVAVGSASGLIFSAAGLGGAAMPALVGFLSQSSGSLRIGMSAALFSLAAMTCLQLRIAGAPWAK